MRYLLAAALLALSYNATAGYEHPSCLSDNPPKEQFLESSGTLLIPCLPYATVFGEQPVYLQIHLQAVPNNEGRVLFEVIYLGFSD